MHTMSSQLRHARAVIDLRFGGVLYGPMSVVKGIKEGMRKAAEAALNGVKLAEWTAFARSREDVYFAFYNGDLLIQYGPTAHTTNLAVGMTEEEADAFAAKYGVRMADSDRAVRMIAYFEAAPEREAKKEQKLQEIMEELEAKPNLGQQVREALSLESMYPEGLFAVVDGKVLFKVTPDTQDEIAELTPDPRAGVTVEEIENYLEEFEAVVLRGEDAQKVVEEFNRQAKKPKPILLRIKGKIAELRERCPDILFLEEDDSLIFCKVGDDGPTVISSLEIPPEIRPISLVSELGLPEIMGPDAEEVRRIVAEANDSVDVKSILANLLAQLS